MPTYRSGRMDEYIGDLAQFQKLSSHENTPS